SFGVRNRNTAYNEKMDSVTDRRKRLVVIKAKTGQEHLIRHAAVDVRELGAIEIKSDGTLGAVARAIDPREFCVLVYEPSDQPNAGQAVYPEVPSRCPYATTVFCRVKPAHFSFCGMRLAAGKQHLR